MIDISNVTVLRTTTSTDPKEVSATIITSGTVGDNIIEEAKIIY